MITMILWKTDITWITPTGLKRDAVSLKFWDGLVTGVEVRQDTATVNGGVK